MRQASTDVVSMHPCLKQNRQEWLVSLNLILIVVRKDRLLTAQMDAQPNRLKQWQNVLGFHLMHLITYIQYRHRR